MKNDLKHLRRSELIDLIYEMKKREIELQTRLDEAEAKLQARSRWKRQEQSQMLQCS